MKSKKLFTGLVALLLFVIMTPVHTSAASKPYEIGFLGFEDSRTKVAGKYFYVDGVAPKKPGSLYVSKSSRSKGKKIATQGVKDASFITVITNGDNVFYTCTDKKNRTSICSVKTSGKGRVSYSKTRGKVKEHFELIGIYKNKLYYATINYSSKSHYQLKCLDLKTKKVSSLSKYFEPFLRVGAFDRKGVNANGRYIYGYADVNQSRTVIYDCKTKRSKVLKNHLEAVVGNKIYCRNVLRDDVDSILSVYNADGTNKKDVFKGRIYSIEKITSRYFKYCVRKDAGTFDLIYYKYDFKTKTSKEISINEYYK